jgi:DNA primase
MIPHETKERILDTVRIEDIVGDFVSLKRRGANYLACCPFHNEKTPSFSVSPSKGIYKCFGCGKTGSAVGFLMEHENMTYPDALKYIAKKYGIDVVEEEEDPEAIIAKQRKESLTLVSEYAAKFFQDNLKEKEGRAVGYAYFKSRGLEDETIEKFGLGWAPSSKRALAGAARQAGYKEEYLVDTGLCTRYDDGNLGDRFYDRAMFPIHSVSGRVIAFGGRTLKTDKSVAKYVNSRETEIYVKNQSLYGIWFAKNAISKLDRCILVEGYLDVISMHQLGITNVVASSGTSLTDNQVRLIRRFTENVTIIYDGYSAGIHAALRGIGLVLEGGLNVKVVLLPDGDDPDSFSRKHSLEEVQEYIAEHEQDFIAFKTETLLGEAKDDPIKRANVITEIADTIALIPDPVKRTVYIDACASRFKIDSAIIFDRVHQSRDRSIIEAQKRKEREAAREQAQANQTTEQPQQQQNHSQAGMPAKKENLTNKKLAPCEEELLSFLVNHGTSELCFDRDSEYYSQEQVLVAEFIDAALAGDDIVFANLPYQKVYDRYFELYDEGLEQEKIQQRLLNDPDMEISSAAASLMIEKYDLTVEAFRNSLTTQGTILVNFVPKSILAYKLKLVELTIERLTASLADPENTEDPGEILLQIQDNTNVKKLLCSKLGRVQ